MAAKFRFPPFSLQNYKKKMETAKKEYLKKLAAYKANRISAVS